MDDLLVVVRGKLTGRAQWLVRRFVRPKAYGEELTLTKTEENEAFGFSWRERRGVVYAKQDEKWVASGEHPEMLPKMPHIYGAMQFDSPAVRTGVVQGYLIRYLDCTNEEEDVVGRGLARLIAVLLEVGYEARVIGKVLRRVKQQALVDIRQMGEEVLSWGKEKRMAFIMAYDKGAADEGLFTKMRRQHARRI